MAYGLGLWFNVYKPPIVLFSELMRMRLFSIMVSEQNISLSR